MEIWQYIIIVPIILIVGLAFVAFGIRIYKIIKLNKVTKGKPLNVSEEQNNEQN